MGITEIYNRFKKHENLFRCPICHTEIRFGNENSLLCKNNHCFDLSKHGYINFAPNQNKTKYAAHLFENRKLIFQAGFYDLLIENIELLIHQYFDPSAPFHIIDAGCGEGFFASHILKDKPPSQEVFAMDLSKDAVILAAKEDRETKWMVGDLSNIPIQSNSLELLLNIFAPANYSEFSRIMKDNGFLIKVIPGREYLKELRDSAKNQLMSKDYSNERVLRHFCEKMICVEQKRLFYQMPAAEHHAKSFIEMTPMMFHVDTAGIQPVGIREITIDVEIIIGKKHMK